jgi:tRNA (adenine37-N6)-methyltransferase
MTEQIKSFQINPIGYVRASEEEQSFILEILEPYRPCLKEMNQFSHVMVFWWAEQLDNEEGRNILTAELPYAPGVVAGMFACRSPARPNPIAMTTTAVIHMDEENGIVVLPWIDALDGTPVIDLKPYIPVSDRIRDYRVAPWAEDWPEWAEDAAEYFAEHAVDFGG